MLGKEADDPVTGVKSTELLDTVSVRLTERGNGESDPCGNCLFFTHFRIVWRPKNAKLLKLCGDSFGQDFKTPLGS